MQYHFIKIGNHIINTNQITHLYKNGALVMIELTTGSLDVDSIEFSGEEAESVWKYFSLHSTDQTPS